MKDSGLRESMIWVWISGGSDGKGVFGDFSSEQAPKGFKLEVLQ
jgi:hypothetical protein